LNGNTTTAKKEQVWKQLSELLMQKGILVTHNPKLVGQKLSRMEMDFKEAHDFMHNTGSGLMSQGQDITKAVRKIFPYYYELGQVMGNRASVQPIDLFDGEDEEEDEEEAVIGRNDDIMLEDDMASRLSYSDGESAVERSTINVGKLSQSGSSSKKHPISLQKFESPSKVAKKHPALVLVTNLSSAVEKVAAQKLQYREALKAQNEAKLLMEKDWKEKQIKWKDVEMKCLMDKTEVEKSKGKMEIDMMEIKRREECLSARLRLEQQGASKADIDCVFPLDFFSATQNF
jgi:hypothetical protein